MKQEESFFLKNLNEQILNPSELNKIESFKTWKLVTVLNRGLKVFTTRPVFFSIITIFLESQ